MNKCRLFRGTILLLFLTFAVGCSSDDSEKGNSNALEGVVSDPNETEVLSAPTPSPMPEISTEELLADSNYEVIYVHDDTLFHLASDMSQPSPIEGNVHPASLALAPDYSTLLFGIKNTEMGIQKLGILNLKTMEITPVELPNGELYMPPVVQGWSANNEWVIVSFSPNNDKVIFLNVWTGVYAQPDWRSEEDLPKKLFALWLTDNRLLVRVEEVVSNEVPAGSYSSIVETYVLDPSTSEQSPVTLSEEGQRSLAIRFSPAALHTLDTELQRQGLALAVPQFSLDQVAYYPEMVGAAAIDFPEQPPDQQTLPCDVWDIQYKPIREVALPQPLYHVKDVSLLSDPYLLPDESLLVAQWKSPDCEQFVPETLTVELLHIQTDGIVTVIASDVSYGWVFDLRDIIYFSLPAYARSTLYAISPEGRYVAWVKRSETTASIMVTDLQTMQAAPLIELEGADSISSVAMFRTKP